MEITFKIGIKAGTNAGITANAPPPIPPAIAPSAVFRKTATIAFSISISPRSTARKCSKPEIKIAAVAPTIAPVAAALPISAIAALNW